MVFKVPLSAFIVIVIGAHVEVFSLQINVPEHYRVRRQASCKHGEFTCKSGDCINSYDKCDGVKQCSDGSDEIEETCRALGITCPLMSFECSYGACIDERLRCDGKPDCADGSDEYRCPGPSPGSSNKATSCGNAEFRCNDGQCIGEYDICDGGRHCRDGTDESWDVCASYECPLRSFKCAYGACVDASLKCNGFADCLDGSDEPYNCPRPTGSSSTRPAVRPAVRPSTLPPTQDAGSCKLPPYPTRGGYTSRVPQCGSNTTLPACRNTPGASVPSDWLIEYTCDNGYTLSSESEFSYCKNGEWLNPVDCISKGDRNTNSPVPPPPLHTEKPSAIPLSTGDCVLPNIGGATKFCSLEGTCDQDCDFYNRRCHIDPGTRKSQPNWPVKIVCKDGYTYVNGNGGDFHIALCHSSRWLPPITPCIKTCGPLLSDELLLECHYNNAVAPCSNQSWKPGTSVSFQCKIGYSEIAVLKSSGAYRKYIECKENGEWSDILPNCKPECGVSGNVTKFTATIVGGQEAHVGLFPWHAGLYYRQEKDGQVFWDQKCAGTLITDRVILTAAHCLYEKEASNVKVALGKFYRSWDVAEPSEIKRDISAIQISPYYDKRGYAFDIALIRLSEKIKFGAYIMPACRDHDLNTTNPQKASGDLHVAGWGQTGANAASSSTLLYNTFTPLSEVECRRRSPVGTVDKFCASSNDSDATVQHGDSGGGVTVVYKDRLHYVVGIVSTKAGEPGAETAFFTNITEKLHYYWIQRELKKWV